MKLKSLFFAFFALFCNRIALAQPADEALLKTLTGHSSGVNAITYSPDGKFLAVANWYEIKIWDTESGNTMLTLAGHSDYVFSVAYSPDGKYLCSGGGDKTVKIWNVASGECVRTLKGHSKTVNSVAYSPNGKYLCSGSWDKTIKIWDVARDACVRTLTGHSDWAQSVAYSPDGKYLCSGGGDKTVKIWDVARGNCIRTMTGHSSLVQSVAYSPDGKFLTSCSSDKTVKIWDVTSGVCLQTMKGHSDQVWDIAYSPDGKYVASVCFDKTVKIWDVASGVCARTLTGHSNWLKSVAYSPDGKYLCSGSEDRTVRIWRNPLFNKSDLVEPPKQAPNDAVYNADSNLPKTSMKSPPANSEYKINSPEAPKSAPKEVLYDVESGLPKTRMKNPDAIAVVIGNRDYQKIQPVAYAVNDAQSIKRYLVEMLGFREGNILYKENASVGDFNAIFGNERSYKGKLYNFVRPGESDVFVFYSGHGSPGFQDGRNYFVPVEADPKSIELSGYPIETFEQNLAKIPARSITVVMDACFSGSNLTAVMRGVSGAKVVVRKPLFLAKGVVLGSSSGDQVSTWYDEAKHGTFTYFFLKAIHNRNADKNHDGKVTLKEIYEYVNGDVQYQSRRMHSIEQTPTLEGMDADKERVLVEY